MLNGAKNETSTLETKEPKLKRVSVTPDEASVTALVTLPEEVKSTEYSGLEIFIKGDVNQPLAELLQKILPRIETESIVLEVNSATFQHHYSKITESILYVNCQKLALVVRLDAQQLEQLLITVMCNANITSFSLKGTYIESELVPVLLERLQAFREAKKQLSHFGLPIAMLNTEIAAKIIQLLGPLGVRTVDFSNNKTQKEAERFDKLCEALLNPEVKLEGLHLTVPFGGEPGKNQTQLFCDALAKIPHNFDLVLTYQALKNFVPEDLAILKETLFLNPRLCIYFVKTTSLAAFQKDIDSILLLSHENACIRSREDGAYAIRQRYDSLVLSGRGDKLKGLAITNEVGIRVSSLQCMVAKIISQNMQRFGQLLSELPSVQLEHLPTHSREQYEEILVGFKNLSLGFDQAKATDADKIRLEVDRRNNILRSFKTAHV